MSQVRAPGRPRSRRAEAAILEATFALLGECGFSGLTVEGIAARAGVSKATIYRHWPGKAQLAVDALRAHIPPLPVADEGDLRSDLLAILRSVQATITSPELSRVLPSLVEAAERDGELEQLFRDFGQERRRAMRAAMDRAQARGELRPDADFDLLADVVVGPLFFRRLVQRVPLGDDYPERLLNLLLPAFQR